jgi:hypothetical protein
MAETPTRRKTKTRQEGTGEAETISSVGVRPTLTPEGVGAPLQPPPIAPEVRDELTSIMQELLLKTHELSFEYSTLDCQSIQKCLLAQKSRELFKVVKQLNELVRKMTPPAKTGYVA